MIHDGFNSSNEIHCYGSIKHPVTSSQQQITALCATAEGRYLFWFMSYKIRAHVSGVAIFRPVPLQDTPLHSTIVAPTEHGCHRLHLGLDGSFSSCHG